MTYLFHVEIIDFSLILTKSQELSHPRTLSDKINDYTNKAVWDVLSAHFLYIFHCRSPINLECSVTNWIRKFQNGTKGCSSNINNDIKLLTKITVLFLSDDSDWQYVIHCKNIKSIPPYDFPYYYVLAYTQIKWMNI